jgi:hypothetical protein
MALFAISYMGELYIRFRKQLGMRCLCTFENVTIFAAKLLLEDGYT